MRNKLAPLLNDAAQVYGAQMVGLVVGFGVSMVVARVLGPEGRGVYGWLMALVAVGLPLGLSGVDVVIRRYVARDPNMAPAMLGTSMKLAASWGVLVACGLALFGMHQPVGFHHMVLLALALVLVPVSVAQGLISATAAGLGKMNWVARIELTQRLLMAALVVVLLTVTLQVWHLLAAQVAAMVVASGWVAVMMRRQHIWPWQVKAKVFTRHRALMLGTLAAQVCWILLQKVDVVMLGVWRPLAETGYYTVALSLIDAMVMLPGTIAFVLMPRLAAELDVHARRSLLLVTLAGVMGLFGAACAVMGFVSGWLIPLLFGAEFTAAVDVFQRLLWAAWLMGGYQVAQNAVAGYGRARYQMAAPLLGLVVKAGLGWLLIADGMLAAANATVVGYAVALLVALAVALSHRDAKRAE